MSNMDEAALQKKFPSYMASIKLPDCAREQAITVYRACKTGKIERESFLNTYEENGFKVSLGQSPDDPQVYCLSTSYRPKGLRRYVSHDGRYNPPWLLAKGTTDPSCGLSCCSKEWVKKKKGNYHVDWWLYEGAEPWKFFEEADYEQEEQHFIQDRQR
ncbi:MAG: hypothetical protein LUD84_10960 [Clostridiales bacterium]|nr:hypothetical protein [Clostridiales bacterium]